MNDKYTIGLDFGTQSGRGVLVRCGDGRIMASAVKPYCTWCHHTTIARRPAAK